MKSRWEYGGEFHWVSAADRPAGPITPPGAVLFATGRDALSALIEMGIRRRGWRRWFLPSYLCQEVTRAIAATAIELIFYDDSPLQSSPVALPPTKPGDVVFVVNYFGLRGAEAVRALAGGPAEIVEDHTHDPWSPWASTSGADYCLASLRKTLPVPDGTPLWSPQGYPLPQCPHLTQQRQSAALTKLAGMFLKRLYLDGEEVAKPMFRQFQVAGEQRIAAGPVSAPSSAAQWLLRSLPWDRWRQIRRSNHSLLTGALAGVPGIQVLQGHSTDSCPFSVILQCQTPEQRQRLRTTLIARDIYPAVLWSIEDQRRSTFAEAAALSRRLLSLPCDFRYGINDLDRVAEAVRLSTCEVDGHRRFAA
jgi:hypothetical protein